MTGWKKFSALCATLLMSCTSTPVPEQPAAEKAAPKTSQTPVTTPATGLVDKVYFSQKDPRWAADRLGKTSDTMESDGCLVSAAAMVLGNLGFSTDPGDLNKRLTEVDGYTAQGWLIWSAIDKVTDNAATARYYDEVSNDIIDGCIADGYYPLARFILPNGRSHWSVIIRRSQFGYHMRDPLHPSDQPLIFPQSVDAFKALRCVGLKSQ